jgi:hypothetical protein
MLINGCQAKKPGVLAELLSFTSLTNVDSLRSRAGRIKLVTLTAAIPVVFVTSITILISQRFVRLLLNLS